MTTQTVRDFATPFSDADDVTSIELTDEQIPERQSPWLIIAVAILVGVLSAVITIALARTSATPAAAAAPAVTHQVTISAKGATSYYDVSGPGLSLSGTTMPGALTVPAGTEIHVTALAKAGATDAACSITVDGVALGFVGIGAAAECDAVVGSIDQPSRVAAASR